MTRIALAMVTVVALAPAAKADHVNWRYHECRHQYSDGQRGWSPVEVRKTIACVAAKFGVSTHKALDIAWRESRWKQHATNSVSGACGVFQHIPRWFAGRLDAVANARPKYRHFDGSCYSARDNIFAALWLVKKYGWSAWGG